MRKWCAVVVAGCVSIAAGQGVVGERAPAHGVGAVARAGLTLDRSGPGWVGVRGTAARQGPLVVPRSEPGGPTPLGVHSVPPGGPIGVHHGTVSVEGGEVVWRVRVDAPGAEAVRLRLRGLALGNGELVVAGSGAGYVVRGAGAMGTGEEWTPVLKGDRAFLEWRGSGGLPSLEVAEVAELMMPRRGGVDLLPCQVDVQCELVDPVARDSVGWVVYSTPQGTFGCTGVLLNDSDPGTTLGWFLTANRCINTASAAASATVYWFYQTEKCNGMAPDPETLPVSQGASLVYHSAATDASLLLLAQDPVQGQGLAGWTGQEPVGAVTAVHHPEGGFKRVSRGEATGSGPICVGSLSFYQYHHVKYSLGITEAGSTGAPLFNGLWQVVGQLSTVCSVQTPACDNPEAWNALYGRMSRTLPQIEGFLGGGFSPARVYVNASASGFNSGVSWMHAYTDLATALRNLRIPAGGVEVWVAAGTYRPAGPGGDVTSSFLMSSGVRVYGGFAGTETELSQRDVGANVTVLSGDLNGDDGPGFSNRADNSYQVVRATGVDGSAVLDGFTIRGGNAFGPATYNDKGGGLFVEGASPRIVGCRFEDNEGNFVGGGAAMFFESETDVEGCTFAGNRARFGAGLGTTGSRGSVVSSVFEGNQAFDDGAGMDAFDSSPMVVTGSTFVGNTAGVRGGAVSFFATATSEMVDCVVKDNTAGYGGGGVHALASQLELTRCTVVGNEAQFFGGGVLHQGGATTTARECRILGNSSGHEGGGVHANSLALTMINCEVAGNGSLLNGGGVWSNKGCVSTLVNCTIAGNTSPLETGGAGFEGSAGTLVNCILWGNAGSGGVNEAAQVAGSMGGTVSLSYSIVQGLTGTLGGAGNLGSDPRFTNAAGLDGVVGTEDDDLALRQGSSARDAGNNSAVEGVLVDIRGRARREEDPCAPDVGAGAAPLVDMGAIEGDACTCYANCDGSTGEPRLTPNDFQCFLDRFAAGDAYANCDGSTGVPALTPNDFQCFLNRFAAGCQ